MGAMCMHAINIGYGRLSAYEHSNALHLVSIAMLTFNLNISRQTEKAISDVVCSCR